MKNTNLGNSPKKKTKKILFNLKQEKNIYRQMSSSNKRARISSMDAPRILFTTSFKTSVRGKP